MSASTDTLVDERRSRGDVATHAAFASKTQPKVAAINRRYALLLIAAVVVVGSIARIILLDRYYITPDADQSIVGLMARHIQHGERPLFYWGQPYTGSGEAYVTAALFAIFGQSDLLLHIVPLAASVAFAGLTTILGLRLYGPGVAWLTGLYLAVPPALLLDWGLWAGSGYLESMALGTAALLLVLPDRVAPHRRRSARIVGAFFLLGFALWVQPLAGYYILAVGAMLVGPFVAAARSPRRWAPGL